MAREYKDKGLVVVGVHTPEFPFERDADNVRWAAAYQRVEYPIALDPGYAVWRAFANNYWPAVYIADAEGKIRHMHFGEGGYEECEMVIQMLLREADRDGVPDNLVSVADEGFEAQAEWGTLGSAETYLGYEQGQKFVSADAAEFDEPRESGVPSGWNSTSGRCRGTGRSGQGRAWRTRPTGASCSASTRATSISSWARRRQALSRTACSSTESLPAIRTGSTSTKGATEPSIGRGSTS